MPPLKLHLLGKFTAKVNDNTLDSFRSKKERALLAYLAMQAGTPLRRLRLAALLWPQKDARSARRNLRLTLHRLRDALVTTGTPEDLISTSRSKVKFEPDHLELDVDRFNELLTPCTQSDCHRTGVCSTCQQRIEKACRLYRGPFLRDLSLDDSIPYTEWLVATRERLQRQALTAMHGLAEVKQRRGELAQARLLAERQLKLAPWREAAHRQLMGLMARAGEPSAALNQLEICRQRLRQQLDLEPSRTTLKLAEQIRSASQVENTLLPPAKTIASWDDKVEEIRHTLGQAEVRLVTICGPNTTDKLVLAREVGHRIQPAFLSGARLIQQKTHPLELSLWQLLAEVFDLSTSKQNTKRNVLRFLQQFETLLLIESIDQRAISTGQLEELLSTCPGIKVLATTTKHFGLEGERLFEIHRLG